MNKKIAVGFAVVAILVGLAVWSTNPSRDAPGRACNVLKGIYSQTIDPIQMLGQLRKNAPVWVPVMSKYLRENYGAKKEVTAEACERGRWTFKVTCEQGEYRMRFSPVPQCQGKLGYIAFRFPGSTDWVNMGKLTNADAARLPNGPH